MLLNAAPMVDLALCDSEELANVENCCSQSCGGGGSTNNDGNEEDDGCNDLCNPFMSCSTCVGFTMPLFEIKSSVVTEVPELIIAMEREHTNSVSFSIWNPPKIS